MVSLNARAASLLSWAALKIGAELMVWRRLSREREMWAKVPLGFVIYVLWCVLVRLQAFLY